MKEYDKHCFHAWKMYDNHFLSTRVLKLVWGGGGGVGKRAELSANDFDRHMEITLCAFIVEKALNMLSSVHFEIVRLHNRSPAIEMIAC